MRWAALVAGLAGVGAALVAGRDLVWGTVAALVVVGVPALMAPAAVGRRVRALAALVGVGVVLAGAAVAAQVAF